MSNALAFEVTADSVGFDAAFKRMSNTAASFGSNVATDLKHLAAGAFSIEATRAFATATVQNVAALKDFSEQASISTTDVQRLQAAAEKVGASFPDMQQGLAKLGAARSGATTGGDQGKLDFFNQMGISLSELNDDSVTTLQLMERIATAVKDVELTPKQRDDFREIFGKGFERVLAAMREMSDLGPIRIISEEDIVAIDKLDKAMSRLKRNAEASAAPFFGAAANALLGAEGEAVETPSQKLKRVGMSGMDLSDWYGLMVEAHPITQITKGLSGGPDPIEKGDEPGAAEARAAAAKKALADKRLKELVGVEQWRRFYDFLDKEAELAERVRKINFEMLSPKEQQLDLQERINEKLREAGQLRFDNKEREAQQKHLEAAALNEQLLGMVDKSPGKIPDADSAAAAGGFIGGAANFNPENFLKRDELNELQQIRENTARIAAKGDGPQLPAKLPVF
jgi:hypothetical protein